MHRLESTARDNGKAVHRIRDILSQPFRARHIINFMRQHDAVEGHRYFETMAYLNIRQSGLVISKGGTAIYGDGAYCFSIATPPPLASHFYIDMEIPPVTGCEQIKVPDIGPYYYRFLPAIGDSIRVKLLGTNIPLSALLMAER